MSGEVGSETTVVLVAGATGGLGEAIARALADTDVSVWVGYGTNEGRARELMGELGGSGVGCVRVDMTSAAGVEKTMNTVVDSSGKLDVLVNAAGINIRQEFLDVDERSLRAVFESNVIGTYLLMQGAARAMLPKGQGRIVNLSSIAAKYALGDRSVYEASKAAVDRLSMSAALELAPKGIAVNVVSPGLVETAMTRKAGAADMEKRARQIPVRRLGLPEEVAAVVKWLAFDAPGYVTGTVIPVDGGRLVK